MRKAKSWYPLFLWDGVDKMGADFRGAPSSALLEVLDLVQSHTLNDHFRATPSMTILSRSTTTSPT